ncbi:hypothetical protein Tco_0779031 [Tanacetum coccineum]
MGRPRIYQSCTTYERVLCLLVRVDIRIMEIEPDFENMTINEYLEYEAEMERQLRRNVHSKRSPTNSGEDGEEGDIYNIWDITIEDIEWIRQFLTPNIPDVMGDVIQPLILKTIHTTLPDKKYVAPATKSTSNDLLEEFGDEILNVTIVDEEVDFNPTKDIEELEILLAKDPQSCFTKIQVHSVIIKPNEEFEPSIHTRPLNPLHRIFESYKSLNKLYKVKRELTSPPWIPLQGDGIRGGLDSGYVLWKPSRDFTRPLGPPSGFEGLLHTLNATMIPTKVIFLAAIQLMYMERCKDANQAARKHFKPDYLDVI